MHRLHKTAYSNLIWHKERGVKCKEAKFYYQQCESYISRPQKEYQLYESPKRIYFCHLINQLSNVVWYFNTCTYEGGSMLSKSKYKRNLIIFLTHREPQNPRLFPKDTDDQAFKFEYKRSPVVFIFFQP